MSVQFPHDNIKPLEHSQESKKEQVASMFDRIAGRYDFMNRFLSAGIDQSWRRKAIKELGRENPAIILDMATGTADMAIMTAKMLKPTQIQGVDLSAEMLAVGRQKIEKEGLAEIIQLEQGDSEAINRPNNTFDAGMIAFGVRNFEHLQQGMQELVRVLKPGGRLIVLEFSKPRFFLAKWFYGLYMGVIAPGLAAFLSPDRKAYQYLNKSANAFPNREAFLEVMKKAGFTETGYKSLSLGICCIYCGRKPVSVS